jgi:antitoxin component of RelBE/YafQ-DinJ toxin-antitoxin module
MVSRKRETHTPNRVVRVEDELWDAAKAKAAERGETVSDAIRRALKRYVASKTPRRPE